MRIHELKCWPDSFTAIADGRKTSEIRKTYDRDFQEGDFLLLREWQPANVPIERYGWTGSVLLAKVTHIDVSACGALPAGVCVMSIERVYPQEPDLISEPKLVPATAPGSISDDVVF